MAKKIFFIILLSALILPVSVSAQLQDYAEGAPRITGGVKGLMDKITNIVGLVFGGLAVVMFVAAGILFLTAQGQAEKIKEARHAALWGAVGVIVGIVAFSIVAIVSSFLK